MLYKHGYAELCYNFSQSSGTQEGGREGGREGGGGGRGWNKVSIRRWTKHSLAATPPPPPAPSPQLSSAVCVCEGGGGGGGGGGNGRVKLALYIIWKIVFENYKPFLLAESDIVLSLYRHIVIININLLWKCHWVLFCIMTVCPSVLWFKTGVAVIDSMLAVSIGFCGIPSSKATSWDLIIREHWTDGGWHLVALVIATVQSLPGNIIDWSLCFVWSWCEWGREGGTVEV